MEFEEWARSKFRKSKKVARIIKDKEKNDGST